MNTEDQAVGRQWGLFPSQGPLNDFQCGQHNSSTDYNMRNMLYKYLIYWKIARCTRQSGQLVYKNIYSPTAIILSQHFFFWREDVLPRENKLSGEEKSCSFLCQPGGGGVLMSVFDWQRWQADRTSNRVLMLPSVCWVCKQAAAPFLILEENCLFVRCLMAWSFMY